MRRFSGEALRQWLGRERETRRRAASAGRFYRGLRYLWSLLIWSRISAGRAGLLRIELPNEVLRRKGVTDPPPRMRVRGGSDGTSFSRGFAEVYAVLFANLQRPDLLSRYRHAIPGPAFRGVYLWDSAFIAQIWKWWDVRVAREVLLAVVELRDGDRLQHVVTEFFKSPYTQPPLIAWAAEQVARCCREPDARLFAGAVYGPLKAYQQWLDKHRQLDNGLYFWAHPYESGVENAPRFSSADEKVTRSTVVIGAADLCSYVVLQCEALAALARRLEQHEDARHFEQRAEQLRARMNRLLWDRHAGLYYDLDGAGAHLRISTIASLLPLWAGVPDPAQARRIVDRIMDPAHYGTLIPLPSVDRAEHAFEKDMWRGPVWINTAYGVIQGLMRYGFEREAAALAHRLCRGVYRVFMAEHQIYEFYDPDAFDTRALRRKRGNLWKMLTLGRGPQRDFVGWSGLVNTLLMEVLLGLEQRPDGLAVRPRLPADCVGQQYVLELADGLRVMVRCTAEDRYEVQWARGADAGFTAAGFAEPVVLAH